MATIKSITRQSPMNFSGVYTNDELSYLKATKAFPVSSPALFFFGDNATGLAGPNIALGNFTPYTPSVRPVANALRRVIPNNTTNMTYACSFYSLNNGDVYSWGANTFGVNGPAASNTMVPQLWTGGPYTKVAQVGGTTAGACFGLKANGELWSSGYNNTGQTARGTGGSHPWGRVGTDLWTDVDGYLEQGFAIRSDGTLWAWGSNNNGRTGLGLLTGNTMVPTQIGTDTDWAKIYAGRDGHYAIKTDGRLYGWGSNANGVIGNGNTTQQNSPVQVGSRTGWKMASRGPSHSVLIHNDGTMWTCGLATDYRRGVAGTGQVTTHVQFGTETNWVAAEAGSNSIIATNTIGEVWFCGAEGLYNTGVPMTKLFKGDPTKICLGQGNRQILIGY